MSNDGGACANVLFFLRSDLIAAGHLTSIKKTPLYGPSLYKHLP